MKSSWKAEEERVRDLEDWIRGGVFMGMRRGDILIIPGVDRGVRVVIGYVWSRYCYDGPSESEDRRGAR